MDLTTIDPTSEETEETSAEVVNHLRQVYYQDDVTEANGVISGDVKPKEGRRKKGTVDAVERPDIYPGLWRQFSVLYR